MGLVLRLRGFCRAGLDVDGQTDARSLHTQKNRKRNDDEVVLVLAENAADFLHRADDGEFLISDADGISYGVPAKEELLCKGAADQANIGAVFGFGGSEVAAQFDGTRVNFGHVGGMPV